MTRLRDGACRLPIKHFHRGLAAVVIAGTAGSVMSVSAQDSNGLALPGQPFNSAPPSPAAARSPAATEDISGIGFGGHFDAHANLLRTYTENLYYSPDGDPNKIQAWGWALQPALDYKNNLPRLQFKASAAASLQTINSPGQHDDYADATLTAGAHWTPLPRDRINTDFAFLIGHDPFGTSRTEGGVLNTAQLDDWRQSSIVIDWVHGVSISGISLEGKLNYTDKTYFTNRAVADFLDYRLLQGEGVAYYAISPKTSVLLDFTGSSIDLPHTLPGFPSRSGTQYELRGGVRWLATAKTSGDLRVGVLRREFNHDSQPAFTGLDWRGTLTWTPESYRTITLATGQRSDQSYIPQGGFINVHYVELQWVEYWTPLFTTRITGNYVRSKFVNAGRSDDDYFGGLFASYQATPRLSLFATGAFGRRNSNASKTDYSRADVFAGIRLGLFSNDY